MKTEPIDFILSTLFISLISAVSFALAWQLSGATEFLMGGYHILADLVVFMLSYGVFSAIAVRGIFRFRPIEPGTYGMDEKAFTVWKLITILYHFGQSALRPFTPIFLTPAVATLYGARLGKDIALGGTLDAPFVISVGEGSVIGAYSLVSGNFTTGDKLIFGPVVLGKKVTIGVNSVIYPNTEIGDGATLLGGSYLMPGTRIPAGETWRGNPARKWIGGSAG